MAEMEEDGLVWARDLAAEYSIGSTSLTLGAILGIAIGGAVLLFFVLAGTGILLVRKKHRRERQQEAQASEDGVREMEMNLETAIRCIQPPESGQGRGRSNSFSRFLPRGDHDIRERWAKPDGLQMPPMAKNLHSPQRGFFRQSSVRDSWPLMTQRPLTFLPGQSTMVLSPVAPPGYVVQNSTRGHKRTASIMGRKNSQDSSASFSPTRDPYTLDVMPYRKIHRRSTSENQLSTILRSTSQRLKEANRNTMTRTLSTMGRFPGLPPSERLPTPPMRKATESREGLMDPDNPESVGSSICEYALTPSPTKRNQRALSRSSPTRSLAPSPRSSNPSPTKSASPTPSAESKDSLCEIETTDLVIPSPLTSPSRSGSRAANRNSMRVSPGGAKDVSVIIHQDAQSSLLGTGPENATRSSKKFEISQRISLSGDPFYSSVRSSKPIMPLSLVQGPRPMYFRKATFGREATPERPASFCSPLRDVSGNVQTPTKRTLPAPPANVDTNPFQWSPQEAMQTRATQTSPKHSAPRRKGHKRSHVVRMSNISRPTSLIVDVVLEEPEGVSPLRLKSKPRDSSLISVSTARSSNSSSSHSITASRRNIIRPPSSSTFNPTVVIAALSTHSLAHSPERSPEAFANPGSELDYSPTLSVCNYYSELDTPTSEDEFFQSKASISTTLPASPTTKRECRLTKKFSGETALFPKPQNQQNEHERLFSFLPLPISPPAPILTPRPASRPLPIITSTMNGLHSKAATPAPPLLTVPGHLTGPRSEPGKHTSATLSPPRESMASTIGMLRRMNSEISTNSCASLGSTDNEPSSPAPPFHTSPINSSLPMVDLPTQPPLSEQRGRSRVSQHYLPLGQPAPRIRERRRNRAPRAEKRDSHRIHKERRRKRVEEQGSGMLIDELTPVKESSSPPASAPNSFDRATARNTITNALGLRFPTLSHEGSASPTRERGSRRGTRERWRDSALQNLERDIFRGLQTDGFGEKNTDPTVDASPSSSSWADATLKPAALVLRRDLHTAEMTELENRRTDMTVNAEDGDASTGPSPRNRWSDALLKPAALAMRQVSKTQLPRPITPPHISGLGLAGVRLLDRDAGDRIRVDNEDLEQDPGKEKERPVSQGLYDGNGFNKSTTESEAVAGGDGSGGAGGGMGKIAGEEKEVMSLRAMEERRARRQRGKERGRERISGFVM